VPPWCPPWIRPWNHRGAWGRLVRAADKKRGSLGYPCPLGGV